MTQVAREVLSLEQRWRSRGLSPREDERWCTLVTTLLRDLKGQDERRRNLRVRGDGAVRISRGVTARVCRLLDLSHGGLHVKGDLCRELRVGRVVELEALVRGDVEVPVGLRCRIVWKRGRWNAGLLVVDHGAGARRQFCSAAYYPCYLNYLSELATA